jgi:DNA-binding transcriptional regulator YiaG
MAEQKTDYEGQSPPLTLAAFKNRASGLGIEHPDFSPPSAEEVKALRKLIGLSQVGLAKLTGVSWNEKGSSAVRKWETISGKESRSISAAAWQLLLIRAGLVKIEPVDHPSYNLDSTNNQ